MKTYGQIQKRILKALDRTEEENKELSSLILHLIMLEKSGYDNYIKEILTSELKEYSEIKRKQAITKTEEKLQELKGETL